MFVNSNYVPIAKNWFVALEKLGLEGHVVTVDDGASASLSKDGYPVIHRPLVSPDLGDLWTHRVNVISELLMDGHDVIHSDADAVWLKDPSAIINASDHDMVFSQGTTWPKESLKRRGFVLCCGFFALRNGPEVREFVSKWALRAEQVRDDQRAINLLVDEEFSSWKIERPYKLGQWGRRFKCSRSLMTTSNGSLSLAVLPHHQFPRQMVDGLEIVVAHPPSGKTLDETRDALRTHGLWFVE